MAKFRISYYVLVGISCLLLFANWNCGTPHLSMSPTENDLARIKYQYPTTSITDLQSGFNLYKVNCSGCHNLHLPSEKTREQWEKVLPEMFIRVKNLSDQEKDLVRQYIYAKS